MTSIGISLEDIILLSIEIPCYIFHGSMAYFIGLQVYKKNRLFESAFFILFLSIAIADIIFYIVALLINIKIPQFGLWTDFYVYTSQGWVSTIGYMTGEYCGIYQALTHFVISVNRFNVFYFPHTFNQNWHGRRFHLILFSLILLPILFQCWHWNHKILYYYVSPTSIAQRVDDKTIQLAISFIGLIIFGGTSILQIILGAATLIKYYKLNKHGQISAQQKAAIILFVHSLCLTGAQLLRALFHASIITATFTSNLALASFMQKRVPIIVNIYALTGSIFLFILSEKVRQSYLQFYFSWIPFCSKNFKLKTSKLVIVGTTSMFLIEIAAAAESKVF